MENKPARAPLDVLDRIFAELEDVTQVAGSFGFRPTSCLCPLLIVCRAWYLVAERRLYASVGFDSRRTLKKPFNNVGEVVYSTIKHNPRLASLIRKIRMAVSFESRDEAFRHAQILRLCKNVQRVSIGGSHSRYLDDLNSTLAQKDLVELTFERLSPLDDAGVGPVTRKMIFRTISEIIRYLFDFPHLRRLSSYTTVTLDDRDCEFDDDNILPSSSLVKGMCLALRSIEIRGSVLKPKHLLILSEIAPSVEVVILAVRGHSPDALVTCLRSWSETLKHLNLLLLEPGVGFGFERVSHVLKDEGALPSLRQIELWLGSHSRREEAESTQIQGAGRVVEEVCKERNIRLSCREKGSRGAYVLRTYNY